MKRKNLIISCGGTGGHFYPGLSVARRHQTDGHHVLLLLSGVNSEKQKEIAEAAGIPACVLAPMPSPGNPVKTFRFLRGFTSGFLQSFKAVKQFEADAALGMGSFASSPVILAAKFRGVPIFLHDGNARVGRANRWLSLFARFLGTAFPAVNADSVHCHCQPIGMPVRPELVAAVGKLTQAEAIAAINAKYHAELRPDLRTILVFGGSQGAAAINRNIPAALQKLAVDDLQVIHLSGQNKLEALKAAYGSTPFRKLLLPASDAMELLYSAADLVISRSGGSSVAELTLFGKPALLIPYPYAAENHQWDNANYLVGHHAAIAVDDADCTIGYAMKTIAAFLDNPDEWQQRAANAAKLAAPRAAETLLEHIFL